MSRTKTFVKVKIKTDICDPEARSRTNSCMDFADFNKRKGDTEEEVVENTEKDIFAKSRKLAGSPTEGTSAGFERFQ